jgi:putative heme-binding domain-containing protein
VITSGRPSIDQTIRLLGIVRGDPVISPAAILGAVERDGFKKEYAVALLDYLAASLDAGWTIPAEQLAKVQAAVPPSEGAAADKLIGRLSESVERQRRQLSQFEPLLKGGDFVRGEKLFFEKAQCVTCHRIWENGGRAGPDLTRVGAIRSGRDILESVLIPSSTIAQGYDTVNVTTKDGESYTGVRVGSGEEPLVLRLASGTEMILHRGEIERIDRSKVSLMPEGMLNTLTQEEVRDLLAFLQHLK